MWVVLGIQNINTIKNEYKNNHIKIKNAIFVADLGKFMKKSKFITVITAILLFMASIPALAQEGIGFKKFNVTEDFTENGFQWFHDAQLLCAGNKGKSNAMTIGWGGIGTLWGRTALTVYVAEKRYTRRLLHQPE